MNREIFISSATNIGPDTENTRIDLADKFELIQNNISCAHQNADAFYMADFILRYQQADGPIVEFGCFQGGMSCKLSLVAGLVGKKYMIFDTFCGLPEDATYQSFEPDMPFLGEFKKNQFSCSANQVQNNLQTYGNLYITQIIEGEIESTLPKNLVNPSFVFIDVDLYPTAKFIIEHIWSKLTSPALFTHESCLIDYVAAIMNLDFWKSHANSLPPKLGHYYQNAEYGLIGAGCLNCLVKDVELFENYAQVLKKVV